MKFCTECGTKIDGTKFCTECGTSITDSTQENQQTQENQEIQPIQENQPIQEIQQTQPNQANQPNQPNKSKTNSKIIFAIIGCLIVGFGAYSLTSNDSSSSSKTNTTSNTSKVESVVDDDDDDDKFVSLIQKDGFTIKNKVLTKYTGSATDIIIPDNVTSIGDNAFEDCSFITSIEIPNSVESISDTAFIGCSNITNITISDDMIRQVYTLFKGTKWYSNATYGLTIENGAVTKYADANPNGLVIIPDSVTSIDWGAFSECTSLTSVIIPDSVTSIEYGAFTSCTSLKSIVIPDSVTVIHDYTFMSCTSLKSVVLPDSITGIGRGAFFECESLIDLNIPDSVTLIVGGIDTIPWFENLNEDFNIVGDGIFLKYAGSDTDVIVPESVNHILDSAFANCSFIESITIININTWIGGMGSEPFSGCTSFYKLNLPHGFSFDETNASSYYDKASFYSL